MRREFGILGSVLGFATLASAWCHADEKENVLPGPINSISDLEDTAKIAFKLADTNNDNQISQKEGVDAGNLIVGGFFFRADTNGDGVLTAQEAQQARDAFFAQQPLLKFVMERARPTNAAQANETRNGQPGTGGTTTVPGRVARNLAIDPMGTIGNLLDTNQDQKIEATELRQAVQTGVSAIYMLADTNQDGQLNLYEINAAVGEVAKSALETSFQAADTDRNSQLSVEEYDKALAEPAHAVFRVLDANADNQLSLAELRRAQQIVADQIARLRVPEPSNSLSNQLRSGGRASGSPRTQTTPAPAPAPAVVNPG